MRHSLILAALVASLSACAGAPPKPEVLATGTVASDFESYELLRVGIAPLDGVNLGDDHSEAIQAAFYAELSRSTPFEVVRLQASDLEETRPSEPYRRGVVHPATTVELSRRFGLDGILFGTVTDRQSFPPQRLSVQMDLVAAETGLVVWQAAVHLDANDSRVRIGLERWNAEGREPTVDAHVALLSPARFAGFAAWQIANLL